MSETVVLVDRKGQQIGLADKLKAHELGQLHLAFSVMIGRVNDQGEIEYLLQKRATSKYHSGGLWSNTCCSHPRSGEPLKEAAARRLYEELGILLSEDLIAAGHFIYQAKLDNKLFEHELDHVFVAFESVNFFLNKDEAAECKWWSLEDIEKSLKEDPSQFTVWFPRVFSMVKKVKAQGNSLSLIEYQLRPYVV